MKSKLHTFLLILFILCAQIAVTQGINKTESLDSILRNIKNPNEKVDLIIAFLEKPENQYLENNIDIANRAYQIAQQNDYALGKVRAMLKLGNSYFRSSNYKKAMEYAQKSKEMSEDLNFENELATSYSLIGTIYNELGDYDISSQYFFKSLELFEKLNDKEGVSRSLGDIGMVFYTQQDYKKALEYYNKALTIAKQISIQSIIKKQYNNIANVYSFLLEYDTAISLYKKALKINIKIGDKLGQASNVINIGYIQMNKGNYDDALLSFRQAFDLAKELNNSRRMAECYFNFGACYYVLDSIDESIDNYKKALQEGQLNRNFRIIASAAQMLDQIYTEKLDTIQAYKYVQLEKTAGDSLNASLKQKIISKLEFQYIYEKQDKEQKLKQQRTNFIIGFVILGLLSGLIIILLIYSHQRIKIKNSNLEKQKITADLNYKKKELTINLMALIKKNEMHAKISKELLLIEKEMPNDKYREAINKLNKELKRTSDEKIWKEFTLRFNEINSDFYEKLLKKYINLTQNELKLCAYLRLNMTSKDISEITGQSITTLESARYRLRRKLGISGSDNNLVSFLSQI